MDLAFTHGSIVLERDLLPEGAVLVRDGVIAWIGPTAQLPHTEAEVIDLGGFYLSPGFIDLHVHGGGGVDATGAAPGTLPTILRTHEACGTTSLCLAVVSAPVDAMHASLQAISLLARDGTGGARLLGAYLEGPFLNPIRAGAHRGDCIQEPDLNLLKAFAVSAGGWLRVVTLAPELPGSLELIRWLAGEMGLVASIGHTSATHEQAFEAIRAGARLVTHLFNAMKPFHHRDPNTAGATMASDELVAELVMDGFHVHPLAAKVALRAMGADRIALVTDGVSIIGTPDGVGTLGGRPICLMDGVAKLEDGTLAGSALTMIDAVRNSIDELGIDYPTAIRCASLVPARVLGIDDRLGSIAVGKHADLLVLDRTDLRVLYSFVGGNRIYRSPY